MDPTANRKEKLGTISLLVVLNLLFGACHRSPSGSSGNQDTARSTVTAQKFDPVSADFCVQTMAQQPSHAFHFSSLRTHEGVNDSLAIEADISPQRIDLTTRTPSGTSTTHYLRADIKGWQMAINMMVAPGPWMERNMARFATRSVGMETVNGLQTDRYTIDTTHDDLSNKGGYLLAMKLRDYKITGDLWLTKTEECVLKYAIDFEGENQDFTVTKTHYEGSIRPE